MNILEKLSSVSGEKPLIANKAVAEQCIGNPGYIDEIVAHIGDKNLKIASDCAEVMTMIAEHRPELIVPYGEILFSYLNHKKSNVRWECAHALALTSHTIVEIIHERLQHIFRVVEEDESIVVRDYAIDILSGYAKIGEEEAKTVYPYLEKTLTIHNSRHAGHAIEGFVNIISKTDFFHNEILKLIEPYETFEKKVVASKANKLKKLILKNVK